MDKFFLCLLCSSALFPDIGTALRCRTGNDEDNEQYYSMMENCRRRYMNQDDRNNGYNSDESSNSNEDNFDRRMMSNGRYNGDSMRNDGMNGYRNNQNNQRSWRDFDNRSGSDFFNRNMSRRMGRDYSDPRSRMNRRNMNNWHFTNSGNFDRRFDDQRYNYDNNQQEYSCVVQCFFNELNLVDQQGYPDRTALNAIMLEDIQDPELRDFIEESIVQCFHYLNLEGKQNKCQYSQSLLNCLIEKGEERCEDWNSQYQYK